MYDKKNMKSALLFLYQLDFRNYVYSISNYNLYVDKEDYLTLFLYIYIF